MTIDPRTRAARIESSPSLPAGHGERFAGFGVMGLPFASGHVLALRRFAAVSIGTAYTSVWHRTPDGDWTFYADVAPRQSCARFFGADARASIETEIRLTWPGPYTLRVEMPSEGFDWSVAVAASMPTRIMNAAARMMPNAAWRNRTVLAAMSTVAGPLLGVGRVGLQGIAPNRQSFIANPRELWAVVDSRARLGDVELGPPGSVNPQARLGDFWIPQRGILAIGDALFETFDPARHLERTMREAAPRDDDH